MQLPVLEHNPHKGDRNTAEGYVQVLRQDGNKLQGVIS